MTEALGAKLVLVAPQRIPLTTVPLEKLLVTQLLKKLILLNPKFHYCAHKYPLLDHLNQSIHTPYHRVSPVLQYFDISNDHMDWDRPYAVKSWLLTLCYIMVLGI
jgi:hypothetical protein